MKHYLGYICALLAAMFNGMIGIFSVEIMSSGLSPYAIAFYKCLIAFVIITGWLIVSKRWSQWIHYLKRLWLPLAIASFFGFFVLQFFETAAYKYEKVTIVVFMLLGASVITTFVLTSILDKKRIQLHEIFSCALAIGGLALIFGVNVVLNDNFLGTFLALIAGVGYGIFLTISPRFKLGSGFLVVNSLMFFGVIYLFVPFAYEGLTFVADISTAVLLIVLALLPTIGGFLCTMKALTLLKSESVQLIELSEPVFALVFSFVILNQTITFWQMVGGLLLMASIYINMAFTFKGSPRSTH